FILGSRRQLGSLVRRSQRVGIFLLLIERDREIEPSHGIAIGAKLGGLSQIGLSGRPVVQVGVDGTERRIGQRERRVVLLGRRTIGRSLDLHEGVVLVLGFGLGDGWLRRLRALGRLRTLCRLRALRGLGRLGASGRGGSICRIRLCESGSCQQEQCKNNRQ